MNKLLTIIVPSYNMENYLEKDLNSLILKSDVFNSLEVLVINDGSKDKTLEIAQQFSKKYPDVFFTIDKKNGNYGSCVNAGLKIARGTFVKVLDADDSFENVNFLKYLLALQRSADNNEDVDLFFTDWHTADENRNIVNKFTRNIEPNKVIDVNQAGEESYLSDMHHHAITYRTSVLKNLNYVQSEGISYTDQEWITIPLLNVQKIKYLPIDLYQYLIGREGQTMDDQVLKNALGKQYTVVSDMINQYNKRKGSCNSFNEKAVKNGILSFLRFIYLKYLIEYKMNDEIHEIDEKIKELDYSFYEDIGNFLVGNKIRLKFVKHWRENPNSLIFKVDRKILLYKMRGSV